MVFEAHGMSFPCTELLLFNYAKVKTVFHSMAPLIMRQMFSIGERSGLQAGQFSTRTLLLRSHAVVIAAACGFALSC